MLERIKKKAAMKTISRIFENDAEVIEAFKITIMDGVTEEGLDAWLEWKIVGSDNNLNQIAREIRDSRKRLNISLGLKKETTQMTPGSPESESDLLNQRMRRYHQALRELALHNAHHGMSGFREFMYHYLRSKTVIGLK